MILSRKQEEANKSIQGYVKCDFIGCTAEPVPFGTYFPRGWNRLSSLPHAGASEIELCPEHNRTIWDLILTKANPHPLPPLPKG